LIHWTAGEDEFYALDHDRDELTNLAGRGSKEEEYLRVRLSETVSRFGDIENESLPVSPDALERLRSLGYIR
jgi:hypothetical protein